MNRRSFRRAGAAAFGLALLAVSAQPAGAQVPPTAASPPPSAAGKGTAREGSGAAAAVLPDPEAAAAPEAGGAGPTDGASASPGPPFAAPLATAGGQPAPAPALALTPGILTSYAYVGGNEGIQFTFAGPGTTSDQSVIEIDGFEVAAGPGEAQAGMTLIETDQAQVTTNGAAAGNATPGVHIRLIEKRGTNEWRGSLRGLFAEPAPGARRSADLSLLPPAQLRSGEDLTANRLRQADDAGLELGGLLLPDRIWMWGSVDRDSDRSLAFGGEPAADHVVRGAGKLDARLSPSSSTVVAWNHASSGGSGQAGGPQRAPETTLDHHGLIDLWRAEETEVLSPSTYFSATAGVIRATDRDLPQGGLGHDIRIDSSGVTSGSWFGTGNERTTTSLRLLADTALRTGRAAQEIRAGIEGRRQAEQSQVNAPGNGLEVTSGSNFAAGPALYPLPPATAVLTAWRDGNLRTRIDRGALWAEDTLAAGSFSATLGLRYDLQSLTDLASSTPGNPLIAQLAPVQFAGAPAIRWQSLSPRFSMSLVGGPGKRLLTRASLGRYASQLSPAVGSQIDPAAPASARFFFNDANGNLALDANEISSLRFWTPAGFDPRLSPGIAPGQVAKDLAPELTDEATLSVDAMLWSDAAVGFHATWRRTRHVLEQRLLVRDRATGEVFVATAADWVPAVATNPLPGQGPVYGFPYFDLRPGLEPTGGTLLANGDRRQDYAGLTLEWRKRLSHRWAASASANWLDWEWRLGPSYLRYADPTDIVGAGNRNGAQVALPSASFGETAIYLNSRWAMNASGLVQLPFGVNASARFDARQGFPYPYFRQVARLSAGPADVQASNHLDYFRGDDLVTLSARLDRDFALSRELSLDLLLEGLNLLDTGTVLRREMDLGVSRVGFANQVLAPRVFRLSLRLAWR